MKLSNLTRQTRGQLLIGDIASSFWTLCVFSFRLCCCAVLFWDGTFWTEKWQIAMSGSGGISNVSKASAWIALINGFFHNVLKSRVARGKLNISLFAGYKTSYVLRCQLPGPSEKTLMEMLIHKIRFERKKMVENMMKGCSWKPNKNFTFVPFPVWLMQNICRFWQLVQKLHKTNL